MPFRACATLILTLCAAHIANCEQVKQASTKLLERMRQLRPLQKVHYSWGLPFEMLTPENPLLIEYVRITHSACLNGQWGSRAHVDVSVRACRQVNSANPKIRASLAITYGPWKKHFGKNLPPTDTGLTHDREVETFRRQMQRFRDWIAAANEKGGSEVSVTAVLLDSERFHVKNDKSSGAAAWNAAVADKHNVLYEIAKLLFPRARIEWYNFGAVIPSAGATGWSQAPIHNLSEKHDAFSVSLYRVPEIGNMRESFRRTAANARAHKVNSVTPWVALGSGYRPNVNDKKEWNFVWDYDLYYSWQIGRELNNSWFGDRPVRFAPWNAAEVVCFWPPAFDKRSRTWPKHFIAYVLGANGEKALH